MPNWCYGGGTVILPKENVKRLRKLFSNSDKKDGEETFYRTFLEYFEYMKDNEKTGLAEIQFESQSAWSVFGCLMESHDGCFTLEQTIKELEIESLDLEFEEEGYDFKEIITYDFETDTLEYICEDIIMYQNMLIEDDSSSEPYNLECVYSKTFTIFPNYTESTRRYEKDTQVYQNVRGGNCE